ncbi:MAG: bifunctional acetate--CoA ligase family protein/GNAT family N-acetyltransferase [Chlamydiae bacterium]|nr:bifunctional acetate--CoA ligase family protein/GNAT family N-acetyltransferase [Chlamydiota bacterium]MBI3265436.1 bifunctional acetate--CoA ligase family protein/GNAT family N-acetyltransferase [Chlamydiota bacterium]
MTKTLKISSLHDPSHDFLGYRDHPLDAIFSPRHVALIGATEKEGSVGRTLLSNLLSHPFGGTIYPVNPKRPSVMGIKAYPTLSSIQDPIDLAIIVTPASTVPPIVKECVNANVKGAIIISAGFKECGAPGIQLEHEIQKYLKESSLRIIGPNCLGVMNPISGLNATFARTLAKPGHVGFISQSGALCTAILDWSLKESFGFSAFVSLGSMLDINWGDMINYLGDDPNTHSIVIYMESIGDAKSFLSAAREVALTKPIIVLKVGQTEEASKAASSHTGTLTGSDEVLDAAFRRSGVLRVERIADLFYMAEVLAKQPLPTGPRLAILTNAGGAGVIATDALIWGGGKLAPLSENTLQKLNQILPPHWSHANPIDILGDASPEKYRQALEIAAEDKESDGLLLILAPQAMTEPTQTAQQIKDHLPKIDKPILASWMGGVDVAKGQNILSEAHIPHFSYPDTAVRIFNYMWQHQQHLKNLYETPTFSLETDKMSSQKSKIEKMIQKIYRQNRTLLTELEAKEILSEYQIPTVQTRHAQNPEQASQIAQEMGYPVVLKLHSQTLTHKTDVGGVQLNLKNSEEVKRAFDSIQNSVTRKRGAKHFLGVTVQPMIQTAGFELILGSSLDPQFGPVILFGLGGKWVEIFKDHSLSLPPLNSTLARLMMERTKIFSAFKGVRGEEAINLGELEKIVVQFSQLVMEQPSIQEIDINPLLASPDQIIALDARIILRPQDLSSSSKTVLTAIRPYPIQYISQWKIKEGQAITFRPIRPEDEPLMVQFHQTLSERSVYSRFFESLKLDQRTTHERMIHRCFIDYDREMALVADLKNSQTENHEILAVGRLSKLRDPSQAEFAVLVNDFYQNQGLGTELLKKLLEIARCEKIHRLAAEILPDNHMMQHICEKLGFDLTRSLGELVKASIQL